MTGHEDTSSHKNPIKPRLSSLPATDVQNFRAKLATFLDSTDEQGRKIGSAKWGVYAFYDFDGEPIYVGQTKESLAGRIRRHLTNQRTDAVAMRVLDPIEIATVRLWPLWQLQSTEPSDPAAKKYLDDAEYTAYYRAIESSKFHAILNEKIPPKAAALVDLPMHIEAALVSDEDRKIQGHPDIRIARRAENLSRLAAVARERGEVTAGLRRVIVVQAIRLAFLGAERLAFAEGNPMPDARAIDMAKLVGSLLESPDDQFNRTTDIALPQKMTTVENDLEEPAEIAGLHTDHSL